MRGVACSARYKVCVPGASGVDLAVLDEGVSFARAHMDGETLGVRTRFKILH